MSFSYKKTGLYALRFEFEKKKIFKESLQDINKMSTLKESNHFDIASIQLGMTI